MYSKQQSKEKKQYTKDEIHPRAQSKWEELRLRGLIGNTTKTQQTNTQETTTQSEQEENN